MKREMLYAFSGYSLTVKVEAKLAEPSPDGEDRTTLILLGLIPDDGHFDIVGINELGERLDGDAIESMIPLIEDFLHVLHDNAVTHAHVAHESAESPNTPAFGKVRDRVN